MIVSGPIGAAAAVTGTTMIAKAATTRERRVRTAFSLVESSPRRTSSRWISTIVRPPKEANRREECDRAACRSSRHFRKFMSFVSIFLRFSCLPSKSRGFDSRRRSRVQFGRIYATVSAAISIGSIIRVAARRHVFSFTRTCANDSKNERRRICVSAGDGRTAGAECMRVGQRSSRCAESERPQGHGDSSFIDNPPWLSHRYRPNRGADEQKASFETKDAFCVVVGRAGFEPAYRFREPNLQSGAINHSTTDPRSGLA